MRKRVSAKQIYRVADKIAKEYKPEKIILFGSHAWGKPHADSDVDLFIVKKTKNISEFARKIDGSVFPRPFPLDLLVYTPQQVKRREKLGDFFIHDILSKGRLLYPKVHDLLELETILLSVEPDIKKLHGDLVVLNRYYITTRYPGDFPEFSWKEAKQAYEAALRVKDFVLEKIK